MPRTPKMQTYASYAPRFKPPRFKNRSRLIAGTVGENDFMRKQNVSHLNIVVFGCGAIGARTIRTIMENRDLHEKLFYQRFHIKAVFDSSGFVYNGSNTGDFNSSLDDATLISVLEWKEKKNPLRVFRDVGHYYTDFERMKPALLGSSNTVIIDTSNEADALQSVFLEHSKKGGGVVMANKKQLSSAQHTFDTMTSPERLPRIGYEATVGSALPFIQTLQNLLVSGDTVYKLEGILSGSVGMMLTKWQRLKNSNLDYEKRKGLFADVVFECHQNGLSEPDPRDDLLGIDSARKAVILARSLGIDCELDSVLQNTTSLLPMDRAKLLAMSPEEFTRVLQDIDEDELERYLFENTVNWSWTGNHTKNLKYVTVIDAETEEIRIELRNYNGDENDRFSVFKYVNGITNALQYTTDSYPAHNPLVVQGPASIGQGPVNSILADLHRVGVAINHTY